MVKPVELETPRLLLRQWQPKDYLPFAALNADARVMAYFPATLTKKQSDAIAERCRALIEKRGWGFWALEYKETKAFIGFVGLHIPSAALPISPCVEIGWRLAYSYWGQGLATEAAREALRFAFDVLQLQQVVSFTAVGNARSRAVMERLGMHYCGDFEHPDVPQQTGLRLHCLYRKNREDQD